MLSGIRIRLIISVNAKTAAAKFPPKIPERNSSTQPNGMFIILNNACINAPSVQAAWRLWLVFFSLFRPFFGHGVIPALTERITP